MNENTPKIPNSKKRELTSPEFDIDLKKNKYASVSSESDADNSLTLEGLDSSVIEPSSVEHVTMASGFAGDQVASYVSDQSLDPSVSDTGFMPHLTIPPSEMVKLSQMLKDTFRGEIVDLVGSVVDGVLKGLREQMSSLEATNSNLLQENEALTTRVATLEKQVEQGEQYSRRNNLRISGMKEDTGSAENTDDMLMKIASDIGSGIQLVDVDRSHRVGDPRKARSRPREIIVKFATYRSRQNFYKRRTSLKDNGYEGVFVNEDLTKFRSNLLYEARKLYKSEHLKGAWSADGNILVKDNTDDIHRITGVSDLDKFNALPPVPREPRAQRPTAGGANRAIGSIFSSQASGSEMSH